MACGLGLWGCGSPQKAGKSPIRGAERILVAPVNLAVRLPPVLEDAVEPVREALIQSLQGRGADVSLVWGPDAWNLWRDAVAKVSGSNGKRENFDALRLRMAEVKKRIKASAASSPLLGLLVDGAPAAMKEIISELDEDTALLEFFSLGDRLVRL